MNKNNNFIKRLTLFIKSHFDALLVDILMIPAAWYGAYWLHFNLEAIPGQTLLHATYYLPILLVTQALAFWFLGLYRGIWSFTSLPDLMRILKAVVIGTLASWLLLYFAQSEIPRSTFILYAWLLINLLSGVRVATRWTQSYHNAFQNGKRALIVGAGQAADLLLRELVKNSGTKNYLPIAIVDDDPKKQGCEIHGIRVAGHLDDIPQLVISKNIELVIIAIPSVQAAVIRKVVNLCKEAKVEFRTIPRLNDIVTGQATINSFRNVALEDLLGREPVHLNWQGITEIISGKKILISGGGGSIGSELCRQVAYLAPLSLIITDNSEFNLYTIDRDLRSKFPNLHLISKLIDITDSSAIQGVMQKHHPDIVFHAAAYKHVPLLEYQIRAAIRNNILGTRNIAEAAAKNNVATFVLISTDKAVYPSNIMGATKRAAEIICQNYNSVANTNFITVRFGNVLGSAGSVVPLFQTQLEQGLDLTVTHPEITRYFMTIPEATQLILQATLLGKGGEIFVLNMGEPVKITALAEQIIYLSGKKLGEDVNIVFTGLRPGEKLHEELFHKDEELIPTQHEKILQSKHQLIESAKLNKLLDKMKVLIESYNCDEELQKILFNLISKQ